MTWHPMRMLRRFQTRHPVLVNALLYHHFGTIRRGRAGVELWWMTEQGGLGPSWVIEFWPTPLGRDYEMHLRVHLLWLHLGLFITGPQLYATDLRDGKLHRYEPKYELIFKEIGYEDATTESPGEGLLDPV